MCCGLLYPTAMTVLALKGLQPRIQSNWRWARADQSGRSQQARCLEDGNGAGGKIAVDADIPGWIFRVKVAVPETTESAVPAGVAAKKPVGKDAKGIAFRQDGHDSCRYIGAPLHAIRRLGGDRQRRDQVAQPHQRPASTPEVAVRFKGKWVLPGGAAVPEEAPDGQSGCPPAG